jgi:hypothetical protein
MQIIVDIAEGEDGRPVGTIRAAGQPGVRSFSGNLEFLAVVENLYQVNTDTAGEASGLNEREES